MPHWAPVHIGTCLFFLLGIRMAGAAMINRLSLLEGGNGDIPSQHCAPAELRTKDIDVVVYGATGYTGGLAMEYIAAWQPKGLRWAIAGRTAGKLEALVQGLALRNVSLPSVLVADLTNDEALLNMTRRARAIITYAGPYEAYGGEALIRAALQGCAHYVDLTGETPWKVLMLQRYGATAVARGVALVQSAGHDSLPADVVAIAAAEEMARDGKGPPDRIKLLYTELNGMLSSGTINSGMYMMSHHLPNLDPYQLAPETPVFARVDLTLEGMWPIGFDSDFRSMTLPYPLASSDSTLIRRSLALRFPGARISVGVGMSGDVPEKFAVFIADPKAIALPLTMGKGQGAPEWLQRKGSIAIKAVAKRSSSPREVRVTMFGAGDPGYSATAKMSAELTLGLALDGPAGGKGGYLTPATALGPGVLQGRLGRAEGGDFFSFS